MTFTAQFEFWILHITGARKNRQTYIFYNEFPQTDTFLNYLFPPPKASKKSNSVCPIGIHPHDAKSWDEETYSELKDAARWEPFIFHQNMIKKNLMMSSPPIDWRIIWPGALSVSPSVSAVSTSIATSLRQRFRLRSSRNRLLFSLQSSQWLLSI